MITKLAILWIVSISFLVDVETLGPPPIPRLPRYEGYYMIQFPQYFNLGENNTISVTMFNTSSNTEILFELFDDKEIIASSVGTFSPDTSTSHQLMLPPTVNKYYVQLRAVGRGGIYFNSTMSTHIARESMLNGQSQKIFIQTDKPIYKPNDWIRFRTFAMNKNLTTSLSPLDISIHDSKGNLLMKWTGETSSTGVVSKSYQLSDRPAIGIWVIKVQQGSSYFEQSIEVSLYKLPKYEVTVEATPFLPDFYRGLLYLYNETIDIDITAKYTFGRSVNGKVQVNISLTSSSDDVHTEYMDIHGVAHLRLPYWKLIETGGVIDVPSYNARCASSRISIKAKVIEDLTGIEMVSPEKFIDIEKAPIKVSHNTLGYLKIGLQNHMQVKIERVDGKPLTEADRYHPLEITYSNNVGEMFPIPADGNIDVALHPTMFQLTNYKMGITYRGTYNGRHFVLRSDAYPTKYNAINNRNIDVTLDKDSYEIGEMMKISVNSTYPLLSLLLTILKDNSIVETRLLNVEDQDDYNLSILATEDMIPKLDILISGLTMDRTFVVDAARIPIIVTLQNNVTADFSKPEGRAGDQVNLNLHTTPGSAVFVMAIDRSIELLKKPKYINEEDILMAGLNGFIKKVTKVYSYGPQEYFRRFDINVMSNIDGLENIKYYTVLREMSSMNRDPIPYGGAGIAEPKVRSFFPETWIWTEESAGQNGEVSIQKTVPDSITKWVANAFAVSPTSGLAVLKKPAEFYSFQPFFVALYYPLSIIRNETFSLKVSVFNYQKTDETVTLTLVKDAENSITTEDVIKTVDVKSNQQGLVIFEVTPPQVGYLSIHIKAKSSHDMDEVLKYIEVRPEGITKYFNKAILLNATMDVPTLKTFTIPDATHDGVVSDSERIEISVIGDMMGPAIDKVSNLIRLPSGCGEQNMINFAPNIYIYKYLQSTNRLTDDKKSQLLEYTIKGYKNELSYQHQDGSYSAFGSKDSKGSTWLTAFVLKCFFQAKKIMPELYIDNSVIRKGLKWLLKQQNQRTGEYMEKGRVIHREMQGGSSEGKSLSAYVLITLLESKELEGIMQPIPDAEPSPEMGFVFSTYPVETFLTSNSSGNYFASKSGSDYSKAIIMYAMALLGKNETFDELETYLESIAIVEGDFKYWKTERLVRVWGREDKIEFLPNIEMSAYMLLSYAKKRDVDKGLPILRWLISQRSSLGGYHSTQDTVIALEAFAAFAPLVTSCCDQLIDVEINDNNDYSYTFPTINHDTSATLYQHVMPSDTKSVTIAGKGKGVALVQVAWQYNILEDESDSNINSSVDSHCITKNKFSLHICNTWMMNSTSGMALIDIQLPSGYAVDVSKYASLENVKRIETEISKVVIYLDKLPKMQYCIEVIAERLHEVKNKDVPLPVTTSLYYETEERVVKTYKADCSHYVMEAV